MEENVFKKLSEVVAGQEHTERTLWPQGFVENHLRHIPEIVQTTELRVVAMTDITNLAFVFTEASLNDTTNFYYCCQGMANAFLLRCRVEDPARLSLLKVPWRTQQTSPTVVKGWRVHFSYDAELKIQSVCLYWSFPEQHKQTSTSVVMGWQMHFSYDAELKIQQLLEEKTMMQGTSIPEETKWHRSWSKCQWRIVFLFHPAMRIRDILTVRSQNLEQHRRSSRR